MREISALKESAPRSRGTMPGASRLPGRHAETRHLAPGDLPLADGVEIRSPIETRTLVIVGRVHAQSLAFQYHVKAWLVRATKRPFRKGGDADEEPAVVELQQERRRIDL